MTRRCCYGGGAVYSQHVLFLDEMVPPAQRKQQLILPPPKVELLHEVFAEAMLEESSAHQRRNPLDWAVSVAVHVAVLAVILILPLYFTTGLDVHKLNLTFLATPLPPAAPPPASMTSSVPARVAHSVPVRAYTSGYTPGKLTVPSFIPRAVAVMPSDAPEPDVTGIPGGVPGGIPGGQMGGVIGGILGGVVVSPPAPVATVAHIVEGPKKPVLVGGDVKPPRLIYGPDPEYPPLAKQSRISGVVVIEAIIDEHGNVTGMKAISGHPLLISAALKAVSKRKYEPTILDGEPRPIDLRVEITFSLV